MTPSSSVHVRYLYAERFSSNLASTPLSLQKEEKPCSLLFVVDIPYSQYTSFFFGLKYTYNQEGGPSGKTCKYGRKWSWLFAQGGCESGIERPFALSFPFPLSPSPCLPLLDSFA